MTFRHQNNQLIKFTMVKPDILGITSGIDLIEADAAGLASAS